MPSRPRQPPAGGGHPAPSIPDEPVGAEEEPGGLFQDELGPSRSGQEGSNRPDGPQMELSAPLVCYGSGSLNEADVAGEIAEERFINRLCYLGCLNEKVNANKSQRSGFTGTFQLMEM